MLEAKSFLSVVKKVGERNFENTVGAFFGSRHRVATGSLFELPSPTRCRSVPMFSTQLTRNTSYYNNTNRVYVGPVLQHWHPNMGSQLELEQSNLGIPNGMALRNHFKNRLHHTNVVDWTLSK